MAFQTTVYKKQALGQPGDFYDATVRRVTAYKLETIDSSMDSIGRVFTFDADGKPQIGGTGKFAGVLIHPRSLARLGLAPSLAQPQGVNAELADMGRVIVKTTGAAAVKDAVRYSMVTGEIAGGGGAVPGQNLAVIPGAFFILFPAVADGLAVIQLGGTIAEG